MISENLSALEDVSIYPIVSLIIFFLVFAFAIVWVIKLDKKYINRMESIPLDFNSENENNFEIKNEIKE
jgi:hypothetical protein